MRVGIPKEIKEHEYRVGLLPHAVNDLTQSGHWIGVETGAGLGIGFSDSDYHHAGAEILFSAQEIYEKSDLIVKVKEPQPSEIAWMHAGQLLFTYLHLAADPEQAELLMRQGVTAIAYETVTDSRGGLPLLQPMSDIAGRVAIQAGAHALEHPQGGAGILLGGTPGVAPANVTILGGGVVGEAALRMALGLGAKVSVLDRSLPRLHELERRYFGRLETIYSTPAAIAKHVTEADLVIGAVLVAGAAAPRLVNRDLLQQMREGSVIVDVAIDQGGCFATSRPTTHSQPTYLVDGVVHYCVTNMPGAVAHTSAFALTNATYPFVMMLAKLGLEAIQGDPHLRAGVNIHRGGMTHQAVSDSLGYPCNEFQV